MRESEFWGYVGHYPTGSLKGDNDHTILPDQSTESYGSFWGMTNPLAVELPGEYNIR